MSLTPDPTGTDRATTPTRLRLGTRGSPLALAQAEETKRRLCDAHGWPDEAVETHIIRTSGDRIQDVALRDVGGKELFTKEIEAALLEARIDVAVHSAKDVETAMPDGLALAGALPREDARDVFVSRLASHPRDLPEGAVIGTASLRRQAVLQRMRPDLKTVLLRGNVGTRLAKLDAGEMDATLLAGAGLNRLGLGRTTPHLHWLSLDEMPPAAGQGVICLQTRVEDAETAALLAPLVHGPSLVCLNAERACLDALGGSCHTPVAVHVRREQDELDLLALILTPDGAWHAEERWRGAAEASELAAREIGTRLREAAIGRVDLA